MSIKMKASKRFRLGQGQSFVWLNIGDQYTVPDESIADHHETTGRGKRAKPKPIKKD